MYVSQSTHPFSLPPLLTLRILGNSSVNPNYGDFTAVRGHDDNFIYSFGHFSDWIYVARVPADQATQFTAYTYWDGETWASQPLENPGSDQRIFWQVNSGQIIWSEYYQAYLAIYAGKFLGAHTSTVSPKRYHAGDIGRRASEVRMARRYKR